jgi:hypothetical protein
MSILYSWGNECLKTYLRCIIMHNTKNDIMGYIWLSGGIILVTFLPQQWVIFMFLYEYSPHNRKVVTHKTTSIVIVKNVIKKK